jgi:hypothetical protein
MTLVSAEERAQRLWGTLSAEGRTRVAGEFERHDVDDVNFLLELGAFDERPPAA